MGLLDIRQTSTIADYQQRFNLMLAEAGAPKPSDADLVVMFFRGLKNAAQEASKVDPVTGMFWTSFEALARHTRAIELADTVTRPAKNPPSKPWMKLKGARMQAKWAKVADGRGRGRGGSGRGRGGRSGGRGFGNGGGRGTHDHEASGSGQPYCKLHGKGNHRTEECKTLLEMFSSWKGPK